MLKINIFLRLLYLFSSLQFNFISFSQLQPKKKKKTKKTPNPQLVKTVIKSEEKKSRSFIHLHFFLNSLNTVMEDQ